ncbi:MAG TPA: FecR domain-containing protein [Burkholderiales bacterium]
MRRSFLAAVLAGLAQLALLARAPVASAIDAPPRRAAARVALVEGDARFLDAYGGAERRPRVGDLLYEGDRIVTGPDGEVQLAMEDGGYLGVRPDTEVQVVAFRAEGRPDDLSVIALARGALRAVTGWIAGGGTGGTGVVLRTPNAAIGVRGTDHEALVVPEGARNAEPGTYDRVYSGATVIESRGGELGVGAGQAGFAPLDGRGARVLERIPEVFRPTRNERRFDGLHDRIQRELEKRRQERRSFNDRDQRGDRAERSERAERPERVERVERVEKVDRVERVERLK